jgi:hypothetical protein
MLHTHVRGKMMVATTKLQGIMGHYFVFVQHLISVHHSCHFAQCLGAQLSATPLFCKLGPAHLSLM